MRAPDKAMTVRFLLAAGVCLVLGCASDPAGPPGTVYSTTPPGPAWSGSALSVAVGGQVNCLVATDGTPWCWGSPRGQEMRVDDGYRGIDANHDANRLRDSVCLANTVPGDLPGWPCNALRPVRMSTRTFTSLSLSSELAPLCGLDAANDAYCWDQGRYLALTPDSTTVGLVAWCGTGGLTGLPSRGTPAWTLPPPRPC